MACPIANCCNGALAPTWATSVCCQISVMNVQMEQGCVKPENVIAHTCSYTVASCSSGYNGEASIRHDSSNNASIRRYNMHSAHYLFLSKTMF